MNPSAECIFLMLKGETVRATPFMSFYSVYNFFNDGECLATQDIITLKEQQNHILSTKLLLNFRSVCSGFEIMGHIVPAGQDRSYSLVSRG